MKTYCKPKNVDIENEEFNQAAVFRCLIGNRKLARRDFRRMLVSTGMVTREEYEEERLSQSYRKIYDAVVAISRDLTQRIRNRNLELKPIRQFQRVDGISRKLRTLSQFTPEHQALEYIAVDALMPMFRAKILPIQYGSIPGRGQVAGKRKIERLLRRKFHGKIDEVKCDIRHAYNSVTVGCVMQLLRRDIRKNKVLLWFMGALLAMYPDGRLVIGGYLPTWLFNYVMSYFLRHLLNAEKSRRGVRQKLIMACVCYADDFSIYGRISNLKKAIRQAATWAYTTLGLKIKDAWIIAYPASFEQEKMTHKARKAGSRKRTPGIDMMGYRVYRTYTIVRNKIFVRIRRQIIRAHRNLSTLGYIPWWRAHKIIAYYGWLVSSDSFGFMRQYNVETIMQAAKRSVAYRTKKIQGVIQNERKLCVAAQ
jgi:hypothetical protein